MKKLALFIALVASTVGFAQSSVKFPFGAADFPSVTVTSKSTAQTFTVTNNLTYVDLGTIDTNKVCTVTIGSTNYLGKQQTPDKGAMLYIKVKSDATARSFTPSTGFTGVALSGTISKTKILSFIYDGSKFVELSTLQID